MKNYFLSIRNCDLCWQHWQVKIYLASFFIMPHQHTQIQWQTYRRLNFLEALHLDPSTSLGTCGRWPRVNIQLFRGLFSGLHLVIGQNLDNTHLEDEECKPHANAVSGSLAKDEESIWVSSPLSFQGWSSLGWTFQALSSRHYLSWWTILGSGPWCPLGWYHCTWVACSLWHTCARWGWEGRSSDSPWQTFPDIPSLEQSCSPNCWIHHSFVHTRQFLLGVSPAHRGALPRPRGWCWGRLRRFQSQQKRRQTNLTPGDFQNLPLRDSSRTFEGLDLGILLKLVTFNFNLFLAFLVILESSQDEINEVVPLHTWLTPVLNGLPDDCGEELSDIRVHDWQIEKTWQRQEEERGQCPWLFSRACPKRQCYQQPVDLWK